MSTDAAIYPDADLPEHLWRIASRDYVGVNEGFHILIDAAAAIARLASALEAARADARAEEREACARVADAHCSDESAATPDGIWAATRIQARDQAAQQIAAAIRNRTPSPPAEEKKT